VSPLDESAEPTVPFLRVIRGGEPTAEETAALVTALSVVAGRGGSVEEAPQSQWASRRAGLRRPLHPGPGAWVASARPSTG
jgi:hypothetical protein